MYKKYFFYHGLLTALIISPLRAWDIIIIWTLRVVWHFHKQTNHYNYYVEPYGGKIFAGLQEIEGDSSLRSE